MTIFSEDTTPQEKDIPTLFQVAVAQETCQREIESLHQLFQKQQTIQDHLHEILRSQGEVIELLYKEIKKNDRQPYS